jgi:uncharacterized protein (TIGR03083 family)
MVHPRLEQPGYDRVTDPVLITKLYQDTKDRITAVVAEAGDLAWNTPVAACPGWSVRDVVAHQVAIAEVWTRGGLTGPPTDAETAAGIARFDDHDEAELLAAWTVAADELERHAETTGIAAPLGDITAHEHDVRSALERPGARDSAAVRQSSDLLLAMLRTPVPLRITVEDFDYRCGPDEGAEIGLTTTRFEALRWRTGRRSRAQLAAMDWTGDPTPVLDHLYLFGPADSHVVE